MRKRLLHLAGIGLVGVLLLAGLPWTVLAQAGTPADVGLGPVRVRFTLEETTPTAVPGVTATPLPTNTPRVTATPLPTDTPRPTLTPTEAPLVVTATPAVAPSPRVEATVTPAELPITGHHGSAMKAAVNLLPLVALLLLAIPALGGLRARRR